MTLTDHTRSSCLNVSPIHRPIVGRVLTSYLGQKTRKTLPLREKFDIDIEYAFAHYEVSMESETMKSIINLFLDMLLKNSKKEIVALAWHDEIPSTLNPEDPIPEEHFVEMERDGRKYFAMYSSTAAYDKYGDGETNIFHGLLDFLIEASREPDLAGVIINPGCDIDMLLPQKDLLHLLRLYEDAKQKGQKSAGTSVVQQCEKTGKNEISLPEAVIIANNKAYELGVKLNPTLTMYADGWLCYFMDKNRNSVCDNCHHFITMTGKYMDIERDSISSRYSIHVNIKQYLKDIKAGQDICEGQKREVRWDDWNEKYGYRVSYELNLTQAVKWAIRQASYVSDVEGADIKVEPYCIQVADGWYFTLLCETAGDKTKKYFVTNHGLCFAQSDLESIPYDENEYKEFNIQRILDVLQKSYDSDKAFDEAEIKKYMETIELSKEIDIDDELLLDKYYGLENPTYKSYVKCITQEMRDWLKEHFNLTFEQIACMNDADYEKVLLAVIDEEIEAIGSRFEKLICDIVTVIGDIDYYV